MLYNIRNFKGGDIMQSKEIYEIYTDASFECVSKLATYSIVITKSQKIKNIISEKIFIALDSSTECEIFAVYQAIIIIKERLLKSKTGARFILKTDCITVKDFFNEDKKIKLFKNNISLYNKIKEDYKRCKELILNSNCVLKLKNISRKVNNIAHKYSYSIFRSFRKNMRYKECVWIEKKHFLELLQEINSKQIKVIIYLFQISNSENIILKTQLQIAEELGMNVAFINKTLKKIIEMKLIEKVKNGKYALLIK